MPPEVYLEKYYNEETRLTSYVIHPSRPYIVLVFNEDGGRVGGLPIGFRTFEKACECAQELILPI
jgi:hypothetical protein